jgi:hypothetical protein
MNEDAHWVRWRCDRGPLSLVDPCQNSAIISHGLAPDFWTQLICVKQGEGFQSLIKTPLDPLKSHACIFSQRLITCLPLLHKGLNAFLHFPDHLLRMGMSARVSRRGNQKSKPTTVSPADAILQTSLCVSSAAVAFNLVCWAFIRVWLDLMMLSVMLR